jgi:hypothetical protein
MHRHALAASLVTIALACAGSKTQMKSVETVQPQAGSVRPTKVLVVGLTQREDLRHAFESDMAARLRQLNLQTVESASVLPAGTPSKEAIRAAVARTSADAVLVSRLAATREQTRIETGPPLGYPVDPFYRPYGFYDYYWSATPYVYQPTYLSTEKVVELETRLYRTAGDGQLIWRGTSETFDPTSALDLIQSVNATVVQRMRQDGVL